jgi:diacylglycerol kinase (CTP)
VSIGFLTLSLYANGYQINQIHPVLLSALVPVATADVLRHNSPAFNRLYIRACGALMRESEVDGYNGVIWYLTGTWVVLRFFPKDIGVMGVLLLSWCDTAASTVGRAWGRHTWSVRHGKSFAGSAAAFVVGFMTAWGFWGWAAPHFGAPNGYDLAPNLFAFQGKLGLPSTIKHLLGWGDDQGTIGGPAALGVLSVFTGLVASASEAVDIFNWDDNFTIPVLCGVGLWGFLKVFGDN